MAYLIIEVVSRATNARWQEYNVLRLYRYKCAVATIQAGSHSAFATKCIFFAFVFVSVYV